MADKEFTRQTGEAIAVCTTPDVCKSPVHPVPYQSFSTFEQTIRTADSVRMTQCVAFTEESRLATTYADDGGVGGGLRSQTFRGMCRPFKYWSSTVRAEGQRICRHDVVMEMNCLGSEGPGNTYGKVYYIECLNCASVTPEGKIVVKEMDQDEESPPEDNGPAPSDSIASQTAKSGGKSAREELGEIGGEVYDRAKQRIGEAKETLEDAYEYGKEVLKDPGKLAEDVKQAGKDAWEGAKKAYEEIKEKGPVDYTKEKAREAWDNSQAKKDWEAGNYGGAGIDLVFEAGKWFIGGKVAQKVLEKVPLPKKKRHTDHDHEHGRGDGEKDTSESDRRESGEKPDEKERNDKPGEEGQRDGQAGEGEDGGRVSERKLTDYEKATIGEQTAHNKMLEKGHKPVGEKTDGVYRPGEKGIDGVYKNSNPPPDYIITEAKYGESRLRRTVDDQKQMSDEWILDRLEKKVGLEEADNIKKAMAAGKVDRMVINTKPDGTVLQKTVDPKGNIIRKFTKPM